MQILKMKKEIIKDCRDYRRYFSPSDVLYNKETASFFFCHRFSHLSAAGSYHAELFFQVVHMNPLDLYDFNEPSDYLTADFAARGNETREKREQLEKLLEDEGVPSLAEKTWNIAQQTALPPRDKEKLFLLLTAAYALASVSPDNAEYSITPVEAENAYLKKKEKRAVDTLSYLLKGKIPVSERPYDIVLRHSKAEKLLEKGEKIVPVKLIATDHIQGAQNVDAKLNIYIENQPKPIRRITVKKGDYIYINFVGDCPVHVHPTESKTANGTAERQQNKLIYTAFGETEIIDCSRFDVICLAAEATAKGFIYISENGIEESNYSRKDDSWLQGNNAVEVTFINGRYVYLTPEGKVRTKLKTDKTEKKYITLSKFREEIINE